MDQCFISFETDEQAREFLALNPGIKSVHFRLEEGLEGILLPMDISENYVNIPEGKGWIEHIQSTQFAGITMSRIINYMEEESYDDEGTVTVSSFREDVRIPPSVVNVRIPPSFSVDDRPSVLFEIPDPVSVLFDFSEVDRIPPEKTKEKKERPKKKPVEVCGNWDGQISPEIVCQMAEDILIPVLKYKKIRVYCPHNSMQEPNKLKTFCVHIWSSWTYQTCRPPSTMWGLKVDCNDVGFGFFSNGNNIPIIETDGNIVGELIENNLYIYHDAVHYDTSRSREILCNIFSEAAKIIENPKKILKSYYDEKIISSMLQQEYLSRDENKISSIKECIKSTEHDIKNLSDKLEKIKGKDKKWKEELQTIELKNKNRKPKFLLEKIKRIPKVKSIKIIGRVLYIGTHPIVCIDPRKNTKHDIGEVELIIPLQKDRSIKILHSDGKGNPHPHVDSGGIPCFGEIMQDIEKIRQEVNISHLINMLIVFLESYYPGDEYTPISNWKIIEKEESSDKKNNEDKQ